MLYRTWEAGPAAGGVVRVDGHLLVTRHHLVRRVLADPVTFAPDNALDAVTPMPTSALRVLVRHGFRLPPTLANNGGASHPAIRAAVADVLHPHRVAGQRPWLTALVRDRAAGLAARLAAGEDVDLYADLAADLPLLVLARMVDLPDAGAAAVKEFARAALELFWAPVDPGRQQDLAAAVGAFHAVLRDFAATGGGLAATLRRLTADPDVVVGALFFLLVAGQETTSQFLTLLLHRLAVTPGWRSARTADLVEEGLRLDPPIVTWRRVAAADTELDGVAVPRGSSVVLWLARAGRDPGVVADPDTFRPGQPGSRRHLAFGAGAHRCVGAQLTRMEAAVVVDTAGHLVDGVRVVREPWCPDNLSFRMPDALVVRSGTSTPGRRR
ncbi:cytochrome P450 [Spirilliplanes yamanashiensis]|uniref:Cytochrome P450 n=1 Tax=Spirilliplanes yamanashiensis TaxID=42233 RepID=A0A8J3Y5H3_9ACTN|nr:cytochrome P450 [Spirilliplanes yamanashiensis]MDP9819427.1 cytochrome P450 [Spirilliplanes yamanashiensis]GIJ01749.1 cytochrome P450 [Spirilliplanes yamanashiensis]